MNDTKSNKIPSRLEIIFFEKYNNVKSLESSTSNDMLYHLSQHNNLKILKPTIPEAVLANKHSLENKHIPRVCFSNSIDGCLLGLQFRDADFKEAPNGILEYVYVAEERSLADAIIINNDELIDYKLVFDAQITGEVWCLSNIRVKCIGTINVISYDKKEPKEIKYRPLLTDRMSSDLRWDEYGFYKRDKCLYTYLPQYTSDIKN